jgi:tol-pal system protein YbgF
MNRVDRWGLCFAFALSLVAFNARATRTSDLEAEVESLKNRVIGVEEREENYRKQVEAVKQGNADQAAALKREQADIKFEIQNIKNDIASLQELVRQLSDRVAALESKPPDQGQPRPQPGDAPDAQNGATAANSTEIKPGDTYALGLDYFNKAKYDSALPQFKAFLKANPQSPNAANAQYWLAECYYRNKDYKNAIIEFDNLRNTYPKAVKMPGAVLKIGLCFEKLGKKAEAEATYKELLDKFPKAAEATQAKTQLANLNKKP